MAGGFTGIFILPLEQSWVDFVGKPDKVQEHCLVGIDFSASVLLLDVHAQLQA